MNINKGKIGNALESVAPNHVVAVANDIYDEALNKYQSELNQQIGQGGYNPPQGGIPKSDLSSSVQASLDKADAAVPNTRTVNGKALSSNITLNASDVGALPSSTTIPTGLSQLNDDSTHRTVTDSEKTNWNDKYTKTEVDNMLVSAPEANVVVVENPSGADPTTLLPQTPAANTIYRVMSADGTYFSEYEHDGTNYVKLADRQYGIDSQPIVNSQKLVSSGGIYNSLEPIRRVRTLGKSDYLQGKFIGPTGSEVSNNNFDVAIYRVVPNSNYLFSGKKSASAYGFYYIYWFDEEENPISGSIWMEDGDTSTRVDELVTSPTNAAYAYISIVRAPDYYGYHAFKVVEYVRSDKLQTNADTAVANLACADAVLSPVSTTNNVFVNAGGKIKTLNNYRIQRYNIEGGGVYAFSGHFWSGTNIPFVVWFDENDECVGYSHNKTDISSDERIIDEVIVAPYDASYCYLNIINALESDFAFKSAKYVDMSEIEEEIGVINENTHVANSKMTPSSVVESVLILPDGTERSNSGYRVWVYDVEPKHQYAFSGTKRSDTYGFYYIYWFDEEENPISGSIWMEDGDDAVLVDKIVSSPKNARYAKVSLYKTLSPYFSLKYTDTDISGRFADINKRMTCATETLEVSSVIDRTFISDNGVQVSNNGYEVLVYMVEGNKVYAFSGTKNASAYGFPYIFWYDSNMTPLGYSIYQTNGDTSIRIDEFVSSPYTAAYAYVNANRYLVGYFALKKTKEKGLNDLQREIDGMGMSHGSSKVVISDMSAFYIRARYNDEKDIIVNYYQNNNGLISQNNAYVGDKTLDDGELMVSANLASSHPDSTGPIRSFTQYWHLFAQHGYPVPTIANNASLTSADVGALWKDQSDRQYKIGQVNSSTVWLLPVIYQDANGHNVRDWHSTLTSTAITTLTYVSGGESGHQTQQITVSSYGQVQLLPIMKSSNRVFLVDGKKVDESGTYYFDNFSVSESQTGYDPATISDWFGNGGSPVLTGASPMVEFTWSHNFCGANSCVNTTIHLLREAKGTYSGTQQQFFFDKGSYKAMFMIPKAKSQNGVELDKPFNSGSSSSPNYNINRTSAHLKDINNPVDRQIGMLYDSIANKYMIGMAAGLSLVKGDTTTEKRNVNRPQGSTLLNFSPSNTNKFYVYATDSSVYNNGYFPAGYFKEIDYYVCYFDPSENVGQVYWYKDGSTYVIYAHCQSAQSALAINVPKIMEGLKLTLVEKTDNTELLTDTVQNGKFFVNYNTSDSNFIVLKAQ